MSSLYFTPGKEPPSTHWIEGWVASELVWRWRLEEKTFASARDQTLVVQSLGDLEIRNNLKYCVRFQVLMVASMKLRIFWDVLRCS
jgi:hypothetical protein